MIDLSKQQLILLALLVSFVTSLATGIVTVSLMDQAPDGTTHTVSQIIEKTIQTIVPADSTATSSVASVISTNDPASAVRAVERSLVRFKSRSGNEIGGMGLVVSKSGVILTDKASIASLIDYAAIMHDGTTVAVAVTQSQDNGDIVFLAPVFIASASTTPHEYSPISFASVPDLGQTVFALSGTTTDTLAQGVVTESPTTSTPSNQFTRVKTSIAADKLIPGSPLFNMQGEVIGMRTSSLADTDGASFISVSQLKGVIPLSR